MPPGEENYNRHLYYHCLGDSPQKDRKIFGEGRPKQEMYGTSLSDDGQYLLLTVMHGWNSTDILVREARIWTPVHSVVEELMPCSTAGSTGTLYMMTNYKASGTDRGG